MRLYHAKGRALVGTGIALSIPDGLYGRVAPRSGLAVKHCINVGAGVIDPDYTGEVKVVYSIMVRKTLKSRRGSYRATYFGKV